MKKDTYLIDYTVYCKNHGIQTHQMRVKNCMSELHAKVKLEDYLKRNHSDFIRVVMHKCVIDFGSIFGSFRGFNPFG